MHGLSVTSKESYNRLEKYTTHRYCRFHDLQSQTNLGDKGDGKILEFREFTGTELCSHLLYFSFEILLWQRG